MTVALDRRVARGMQRQLALRRTRIDAGERPIGWKIGFGSRAAMEKLATSAPLVGFLTDASLAEGGSTLSLAGWVRPMFEPEVAVHLIRDLQGSPSRSEVEAAIGGFGAAIELADVAELPVDVEEILAGNIFHRKLVLGPARPGCSMEDVTANVWVREQEVGRTDDPQALTGELVSLVTHVAGLLAGVGECLRAGEVVITGSVLPPMPAPAGAGIRYELDPVGVLELRFAD